MYEKHSNILSAISTVNCMALALEVLFLESLEYLIIRFAKERKISSILHPKSSCKSLSRKYKSNAQFFTQTLMYYNYRARTLNNCK